MKNILIMTGSLNVGGIEKALVEMLKIIPYDKHNVDLLLEEPEGVYLNDLPKEVKIIRNNTIANCLYKSRELQVKEYFLKGKFLSAFRLLYESVIYKITKNICRYFNWQCSRMDKLDKEYDVAIAYHNPFRFPGHYVIKNVKAKKKILWNHTDLLYDKINLIGFNELYEKYDIICSVSNAAKESFETLFPNLKNKTTVYYNVLDKNKIIEKSHEFDIKTKKTFPILLTVGRLSPEKGQDRIPEIAKILRDNGMEFLWYIVGGGNLENAIKEKIICYNLENYVIMTGNQENPYPYMKMCDIYVQTSWQEGFPMAIGEAMTFNKPCVVTDVGGTREYFNKPDMAEIVSVNTNQKIADAIMKLVKNKNYYNNIKENISKKEEIDYIKNFIELIE